MSATARYVVTADDKTKAALASINTGFKNMERGIKGTVRGINASLSILAGVGIKRAFQAIFTETANSSKEFAGALGDVKLAAKDLLSPEDGAPAATAALKELAATLKDPEVVKAADDITSALILGFAKAAEATSGYFTFVSQGFRGWQVMLGLTGDPIENLRVEIERIDAQVKSLQDTLPGVSGKVAQQLRLDIAALTAQSNILARAQMKLIEGQAPAAAGTSLGFDTSLPGGLPGFDVGELNIADDLAKQMKEFQRLENIVPGANDPFVERFEKFIESFESDINSGVIETAQRASDSISEIGDKLGEDILGKATDLSVFAEEAARNMQGAFADFLFDPFEDGLDGMLKGFIDVIRRMIAEAAAAQIFESLFGVGKKGGSGAGGVLGSILGGLFGGYKAEGGPLQQGKWYVAGERGPEPIWGGGAGAFAMGYGGGGNVTVHMHNDFRGATQDAVKLFIAQQPQIVSQAAQLAEANLRDKRRRRQF